MVKTEIEVEAATAAELVEALQQIIYYQDDEHFMVLLSVGWIDDDGVRPRWAASLAQQMVTSGGADDATAS
jgi:hypothetical protein